MNTESGETPEEKAPLVVDFDDTGKRLHIWEGVRLVGQLYPCAGCTPLEELVDMRWQGWLSSSAVVEIFRTKIAVIRDESAGNPYGRLPQENAAEGGSDFGWTGRGLRADHDGQAMAAVP